MPPLKPKTQPLGLRNFASIPKARDKEDNQEETA
jgi:hypothetical protein